MQNQITECILKQMKFKGVTQNDLAVVLNCTQTAVSNLLNGKSRLTIDDLSIISNRLGITLSELITESNQFVNSPVNIPNKAEELITENAFSFYLINRLRHPTSLDEIVKELNLNESSRIYLANLIEELLSNKVIEFNEQNQLFLNLNSEKILHYRLTDKYSDRIVEIYRNLRPVISKVIKNEKILEKWKAKNLDSFYCEFFTEDQIKKQNELQREFLNLVKHQIRINNSSIKIPSSEKKELRVIYTVLAPYPITELINE